MKKILLLLFLMALGLPPLIAQSSKTRLLKPADFQQKVVTVINKKNRSYYQLDATRASVVQVKGPGHLRVISRAMFAKTASDKTSYSIQYQVDGGEKQTKKFSGVKHAANATFKEGSLGKPGTGEDFEITLGRGDHTIRFVSNTPAQPVAMRYILVPAKAKKRDWISFTPLKPMEPVELVSRESGITYYRFSNEKPLRVEVIGPTQLRVLSRIENHYNMRGRIDYRLQVSENGKTINTYLLSSSRSEVATYKDNSKLIPGKGCEFVIEVPDGKHTYIVTLLDKSDQTVLGRLLLPKKDVGLED
jgi:hypothetical protein